MNNKLIFEKDGKVFQNPLRLEKKIIYNPTIEQLEQAGYHLKYTATRNRPKPTISKFSKLKIIEELGDKWSEKKAMLEQAGVWDVFDQAEYLSMAHPVFRQFFNSLTDAEKKILRQKCRWTKD